MLAALASLQAAPSVHAQAAAAPTASAAASTAVADPVLQGRLVVNNRPIFTFHATLLGRMPRERALAAGTAVAAVVERGGPGQVTLQRADDGRYTAVQIDGLIVFHVTAEDLDPGASLDSAAGAVRNRLQVAVNETIEKKDPRRIGMGILYSVVATAIAYLLLRAAFALRRRALVRVTSMIDAWNPTRRRSLFGTYLHHARSATLLVTLVLTWAVVLVLLYTWATFVLRQFAYTRAWGERSTEWIVELLERMGADILGAVPGLITALVIFLIARLVTRVNTALMQRIESGELEVAWLDADTADPTRRIGNFVVWLFALALAYPFLPGSDSEAFKGVSVLAGLMISLGASSVVGQVMSGLSLMYSRTLRVGEFIKVGGIEGTVTTIGMFAIKVHTGMGEEVSLPNSVVVGQAVLNYSRLAHGKFVLHTAVTIGYSTPWRQVHSMLLEAARRTPGVADEPKPYVVQTALSDFYVEYRLCGQSSELAPERRAEALSQLHGHVQDVFNENGVQIMSPHYMADPAQPQVVAPAHWAPGLAPAATAAKPEP
ncbi:MAG TPA: mechanosensitive ion channel domain-containing protein [Burkholderiaceae bacterium]|nr:mechanosensitive ion channel domain-containing protein [Burkholderiaceae bacterium]